MGEERHRGRRAKRRKVWARNPVPVGTSHNQYTKRSAVEDHRQAIALVRIEREMETKRTHRESVKIFDRFKALACLEGERHSGSYMKVGV